MSDAIYRKELGESVLRFVDERIDASCTLSIRLDEAEALVSKQRQHAREIRKAMGEDNDLLDKLFDVEETMEDISCEQSYVQGFIDAMNMFCDDIEVPPAFFALLSLGGNDNE